MTFESQNSVTDIPFTPQDLSGKNDVIIFDKPVSDLPTAYQTYIHVSKYARWRDDLGRRETWEETVNRYISFMCDKQCKDKIPEKTKEKLKQAILNLEVMPSMRCLMTAGKALERDNVAGYNCSFISIDDPRAFDEIMYLLMNGVGCGFSVERQHINKLPLISEEMHDSNTTISVPDSKIGWATSYRELVSLLYSGKVPKWDLSKVREAGSRLKTFGGRASGPGPLENLFKFTVNIFKGAVGRKLNSIECHDLVCMVADSIISGGVRRSALISLSNLSDERMRKAKSGEWYIHNPHRALANNSVSYTEKPDIGIFMTEWLSLYESKSGERGIFNRVSAKKQIESIEGNRRDSNHEFGINPCSEIILRPNGQLCNLTEVVIKSNDDKETLKRKVEMASIMGTMQATLTNFRYLRSQWQKNTEEERLLGVSLTGIMDNDLTNGKKGKNKLKDLLDSLRKEAIRVNKEWAKKLDIEQSTAITCVKPSGSVSQLCDTSSGIHTRHSKYYIRRIRGNKVDPLTRFMMDQNVPYEEEIGKEDVRVVFAFPVKSPLNSMFRDSLSAIEQLEIWHLYQTHWCEHKPSVTISVKEEEWLEVGSWVYKYFDDVSGVSFLPYDGHIYRQAPYEEITREQYTEMMKVFPKHIDFLKLVEYEKEDNTVGSQELACTANGCEVK